MPAASFIQNSNASPTQKPATQDAASDAAPGRLFNAEDFVLADLQPPDIWHRIINTSVRERASDIHVSFQHDQCFLGVRVDGALAPQGALPAELGQRVVNHVKVTANLDPSERRRPQDGRIGIEVDGRPIDLRVSLFPTNHGESLAIRVQDRERSLLGLNDLGMGTRQLHALASLIEAPSGLVLVTGPTGAGKTTTLYAILQRLADRTRKVVTVEDPIEYDLPGIDQAEVNYRIGLDYAVLLRAALRMDPNVIMIGEVRDSETAQALVRAANAGRLVFATTHAVNAAAAVESLVALGAHPHFLARAFRGAIAQTLVRRLCQYCTVPLTETADTLLFDDVQAWLAPHEKPTLSLGRGCPDCRHTGYRGRLGIFEMLVSNETIRDLIARGAPAHHINEVAQQEGAMMTIEQAGKLAALHGKTTVEELVQNVAQIWSHGG